jgi:hypothetical protein
MSGIVPRFQHGGPVTYEVVEAVAGGQLVEGRAASKIGVAAVNSLKCLGVSTKDATPTASGSSTDSFGNPVQSLVEVTKYTAVGGTPQIYPVTFAADCTFGALVKCAANGQVTPWVAGTDAPERIVGRCVSEAGVTVSASAVGYVKFYV